MEENKDLPLGCTVENEVLTIRVGVDTLAFAFEHSIYNNPFDEKINDYKRLHEIADKAKFAEDVRRAILDEREDGSSILTDLFDLAEKNAVEDGSLGVKDS